MGLKSFNTPLVLSLVFLAIAGLRVIAAVPEFLGAAMTASLEADPTARRLDTFLNRGAEDLANYRDRFDGRSLFFKPKPPPKKPTPRPPTVKRDTPPPQPQPTGPPPAPREYQGPSVMFVLGEEVWFHGGMRLSVGETDDGVTVISSDAPWAVRLGHRGGEYDIELYKKTYPGINAATPASSGVPGLEVVEATEVVEAKEDADAGAHEASESEQQQ